MTPSNVIDHPVVARAPWRTLRQRMRDLRDRRAIDKLCGICGVNRPRRGLKTCDECICVNSSIRLSHQAGGGCTDCKERAVPGRSKCQPHLDRDNGRRQRERERQRAA